MKMYPQYLREAGYYCTNNSKEDYNLEKPGKVWDELQQARPTGGTAPKDSRSSPSSTCTITHESQIRTRPHHWVHDPAKVRDSRLPSRHAARCARTGRNTTTTSPPWTGRPASDPGGPDEGRPGRRHHRLLLRRPRLAACRAASAGRTTPACTSDARAPAREVPAPGRSASTAPARSATAWSASSIWPRRCSAWPASSPRTTCRAARSWDRTTPPERPYQLRLPRPHGRALRPGPHRPRQALRLHPQLHAAPDLRPVHRLHVPDADHARVEAALRRRQAERRRNRSSGRPSRPRNSTISRTIPTRSTTWPDPPAIARFSSACARRSGTWRPGCGTSAFCRRPRSTAGPRDPPLTKPGTTTSVIRWRGSWRRRNWRRR